MELFASRHGSRTERSRRNLHILAFDCVDHIRDREIQRGEFFIVQPETHRVIAAAEQLDLRSAGNAFEFVDDIDCGVIAQKQRIVTAVRRIKRDCQQDIAGLLLHDDAFALNRFGKL